MKIIRRLLLDMFLWFFWKNLHMGLKSVLGHNSLSESIQEMTAIENTMRIENELNADEKITWENSAKTDREIYAKYSTLKYFNDIGAMLSYFRNVDKNKIIKG